MRGSGYGFGNRQITTDAGAAKTAIAARILGEILLMIVLGKIEFGRVENLGGNHRVTGGGERRLIDATRCFGISFLIGMDFQALLILQPKVWWVNLRKDRDFTLKIMS